MGWAAGGAEGRRRGRAELAPRRVRAADVWFRVAFSVLLSFSHFYDTCESPKPSIPVHPCMRPACFAEGIPRPCTSLDVVPTPNLPSMAVTIHSSMQLYPYFSRPTCSIFAFTLDLRPKRYLSAKARQAVLWISVDAANSCDCNLEVHKSILGLATRCGDAVAVLQRQRQRWFLFACQRLARWKYLLLEVAGGGEVLVYIAQHRRIACAGCLLEFLTSDLPCCVESTWDGSLDMLSIGWSLSLVGRIIITDSRGDNPTV